MRRAGTAAVVIAVLAMTTAGATETGPSISGLSGSASAGTVTVSGTATFSGAPAVVGIDPEGNAAVPGLGGDLVEAVIHPVSPEELVFRLRVADAPPELHGTPEAVGYSWNFSVHSDGDKVGDFRLQAIRSGTVWDAWAGRSDVAEPTFSLVPCAPSASSPRACPQTNITYLDGQIEDGVIQWFVPASLVKADPGALIVEASGGVNASVNGSGWVWWQEGALRIDGILTDAYTVPTPTVRVGLVSEGSDSADVELPVVAELTTSTGVFSATLPLPQDSDVIAVAAEACFGNDSCTRSSVALDG